MKRVIAAARSLPGRVGALICGVGGVALIVHALGVETVGHALVGAAPYMPVIVVLEACILACSMRALRSLYGDAARAVPARAFVRAGLVGYAVMGLVPLGSAAADVTRASLLARWVGAGHAAAAAARMQAVVLIANGIVSIPAMIAALVAVGASWLPLAIAINAAVTLGLGGSLFVLARRSRIGAWLGRRVQRAKIFGAELDSALVQAPGLPLRAIGWELAGRGIQVVQCVVLVVCVGGPFGITAALCAEGVHLVGAAVGNLVPGQLAVHEGNFTLASGALGLAATSAVSIALVAHIAQLVWVIVGSIVPFAWPIARIATSPPPTHGPGSDEGAG